MSVTAKPLTVYAPEGDTADEKALAQIQMVMSDDRAVAGVLCADHHLGYSMPIGGVVAYLDAISPTGVGYDIACGNKAALTGLSIDDLPPATLRRVVDEIARKIDFGIGGTLDTPVDHALFDQHASTLGELDRLGGKRQALSQKARAQLGTVGSGNHYVDLLADEHGRVWAACHFGSRGFGWTIAQGFMNLARNHDFDYRGKEQEEAIVFDVGTDLGQFYIAAMHAAGDYAYAGRDYVIDEVLGILGTAPVSEVHLHHNFAWLEDGLWIVRKGATPLVAGELAFIGGSMGDGAVIVRRNETVTESVFDHDGHPALGRGWRSRDLDSAPHGAGRVMSRTKAAGKQRRKTLYGCPDRDCDYTITPQRHDEVGVFCPEHPGKRLRKFTQFTKVSEGVVDWPTVQQMLKSQGIELRGAGADEAPEVYKSLDAVITAHRNIEIVHRLEPLGVVMAGADIVDPYKD